MSPDLDVTKLQASLFSFHFGTEYKHTQLKLEAPSKDSTLRQRYSQHYLLPPVLCLLFELFSPLAGPHFLLLSPSTLIPPTALLLRQPLRYTFLLPSPSFGPSPPLFYSFHTDFLPFSKNINITGDHSLALQDLPAIVLKSN